MLEELNHFAVKLDIKVRWNDMDTSQQVNSVCYFRWFEIARVEYFIRLGLDIIDNDEEPGFAVKQQAISYLSPVTFPDTIVVGIRAIHVDREKVEFEAAFYSRRHHTAVARASAIMEAYQFSNKSNMLLPVHLQRRIAQLDQIPVEEFEEPNHFDLNVSIPQFSDEEISREWLGEPPKS
jgi:acyl-CoA thioester hydrolase